MDEQAKLQKPICSIEELSNLMGNSRSSFTAGEPPLRITGRLFRHSFDFVDNIFVNRGVYLRTVIFDECDFEQDLRIGRYQHVKTIRFVSCNFLKKLTYQQALYDDFSSNIFKNGLEIDLADCRGAIHIKNMNVDGKFHLIGEVASLCLENINTAKKTAAQSIFLKVKTTESIKIKTAKGNELFIYNSNSDGEIQFENIFFTTTTIKHVNINNGISIKDSDLGSITLKAIGGEKRELNIKTSDINTFFLEVDELRKLSLRDGKIDSVLLYGTNSSDSTININNLIVGNLRFENLINKGSIGLRQVEIPRDGCISFLSSNIGKVDFILCDFSKARMEFENSKIIESFLSETKFPKRVYLNKKVNHAQAQLVFGQLVTAYQKQGDTVNALEYNSREIDAHFRKMKLFSWDVLHVLNLGLNWISNNFGRNWFLGICFSLLTGFVFFCLLLISTENYEWGFSWPNTKLTAAYLKFMNPLRFFEIQHVFNDTFQEGKIQFTQWSFVIDFLGRVMIAYGFYQTIQAFRRYGRK